MKYGELSLGQIEALVNKLGGMDGVRRFLADELIVSESTVTGTFKRDMRKEGWKLLENTSRCLTSATDLEGVSFLKGSEGYVSGEEMVRRARIELDANYGQEDAEWLLEHQDEISVELRKFYLVFTATVWEAPDGRRHVAYLRWNGERWCLVFNRLGRDWYGSDRLPRPRKPALAGK